MRRHGEKELERQAPGRWTRDWASEEDSIDSVPRPSRLAVGTEVGAAAWASPDETTHVGTRAGHARVACVSGAGDVTELTHQGLPQVGTPEVENLLRVPQTPSRANRTQLWQVMSREVVCVRRDLHAALLLPLMTALDVRALAVVDDAGRPLGMVSRSDVLEPRAVRETVADVMMCMAFMLSESASLSRAAALMSYEKVYRLPVVADDGRMVGLISALDVARWLAQHDGYVVPDPTTKVARFDFLLHVAATIARTKGAAAHMQIDPSVE